jgi:hypothetical protein
MYGGDMTELEELKNRVKLLESALSLKDQGYDIIIVPKPEPKKWTAYWNVYARKGRCHAHVKTSLQFANNSCFPDRLACIRIDWVEGQKEGKWTDVTNGEEQPSRES